MLQVIRGGEAGRRGARWHNVTFTLDFLALKGLTFKAVVESNTSFS